jgi:hypothetical protein
MWNGWIQYAGNEIINVQRTEHYALQARLPWFRPVYKNDSLGPMLGDAEYNTPLMDDAPWTDPNVPQSYAFYGVYPLDITGAEDSSRTSTVTENTGDGGNPGRLRHGTKSVVFSALLIGEDEAAVEYGFNWLKQALLPNPCSGATGDCSGEELCYLASEPSYSTSPTLTVIPSQPVVPVDLDGGTPDVAGGDDYDGGGADDEGVVTEDEDGGPVTVTGGTPAAIISTDVPATDCLTPLQRTLLNVSVNSGPTITAKRRTSDGTPIWTVSFTAVAGDPWEFGAEVPVLAGFLDPDVDVPWAGGVIPDGGYVDLDGALFSDADCAQPTFAALADPLCPAVIPPPLPPSVPIGCYTPPAHWRRRQITIPRTYIPLWGEVVPKFSVHARDADVRNLRLRFYADVDGDGDISDDPCAYCGDLVVSYVPQGFTLVFDAAARQVYAFDATHQRRPVTELVFSTDGTPFDWPALSCGMGYVVTLDLPQTQPPPVFDLSLFPRAA